MKRSVLNLIGFLVVGYLIIYLFSFLFFSIISVDTVIGVGLIFLFYLFYFFGHKQVSSLLLSQSKSIFVFFAKLMYLVSTLKIFVLTLNESYLKFLWYKFNGLRLSLLDVNFVDLKLNLIRSFNINKLYNVFFLKLLFMEKFVKVLNSLNLLNNNSYINFNVLIILDCVNSLNHG